MNVQRGVTLIRIDVPLLLYDGQWLLRARDGFNNNCLVSDAKTV